MKTNIVIRKINKDELNQLLNLYKDLRGKDDPLPSRDKVKTIWNDICTNSSMHCFVLLYENQIVSTCNLTIIPNLTHGARPYGLMENVVTKKEQQGKGFGSTILKHALNIAWKQNCYKVMLLTSRKEEKVLRFYKKVGFKHGIKTGFIAYPKKLQKIEKNSKKENKLKSE